jgi:hypothetical protein
VPVENWRKSAEVQVLRSTCSNRNQFFSFTSDGSPNQSSSRQQQQRHAQEQMLRLRGWDNCSVRDLLCRPTSTPPRALHGARGTRPGDGTVRHQTESFAACDGKKTAAPNFFSIESRTKLWYHLLASNAKTRSNTRHDFYVENPCGKNHGRQSAIFTIMRELQRMEYNEPSHSSVWLTRCIYMVVD